MINPIYRILIFVTIALVICMSGSGLIDKGIHTYHEQRIEWLTEILEKKTAYDVLFLGSSRTHNAINPHVIDSICSTNSYNAGMNGANIFEFSMLLDAYLENHPPPAYLVLTLDVPSFSLPQKIFTPSQYIIFTDNPVIRRSLSDNGYLSGFPESFSFLRMTCYDDKDKQDAIEGLNHQRHLYFSWYSYKGFLSDTLQVSSPADSAEHTPILMNVSSGSLDYLHHIIKTCRELGIRLIFTYAPEYKSLRQLRYSDSKQVFRLIYDTVRANNIPYLRHDSLSICTDPSLFRDVSHLNRKGADTYSIILATKLREIMNDSNINHWLRPGLR